MKKLSILSLLVCTSALAQTPPAPPKPVVVQPGKKYEKCLNLDAGQKLEYRFESSAKVNFNLNFKKSADETYYPVKLDRTNGEGGIYEAKSRNRYCLVWENRTDKDVELTLNTRVAK